MPKLTELVQGEFYEVHYKSGPGFVGPASGYEGCYVLATSADEAVVVRLNEPHAQERGLDMDIATETNFCRTVFEEDTDEWPPASIVFTPL
jgi:hypothetical protein